MGLLLSSLLPFYLFTGRKVVRRSDVAGSASGTRVLSGVFTVCSFSSVTGLLPTPAPLFRGPGLPPFIDREAEAQRWIVSPDSQTSTISTLL